MTPVEVCGWRSVIACLFEVVGLVFVRSNFPDPFAVDSEFANLLVRFSTMPRFQGVKYFYIFREVPLGEDTRCWTVDCFKDCDLAMFEATFATRAVIYPNRVASDTVADAIDGWAAVGFSFFAKFGVADNCQSSPILFLLRQGYPVVGGRKGVDFDLRPFRFFVVFVVTYQLYVALLSKARLFLRPPRFEVFSSLSDSSRVGAGLKAVISASCETVVSGYSFATRTNNECYYARAYGAYACGCWVV